MGQVNQQPLPARNTKLCFARFPISFCPASPFIDPKTDVTHLTGGYSKRKVTWNTVVGGAWMT